MFSLPTQSLWEAPVKQQPDPCRLPETQHLPAAFTRSIFIWNWYPQKIRVAILYCSFVDGLPPNCFVFLNCIVGGVEGSCLCLFLQETYGTDLPVGQASFCHVSQPHAHRENGPNFRAFNSLHPVLLLLLQLCLLLFITSPLVRFDIHTCPASYPTQMRLCANNVEHHDNGTLKLVLLLFDTSCHSQRHVLLPT